MQAGYRRRSRIGPSGVVKMKVTAPEYLFSYTQAYGLSPTVKSGMRYRVYEASDPDG